MLPKLSGMNVSIEQWMEHLSPQELQRRLSSLMKLVEMTRILAAEIDLDKTLAAITLASCSILDCERASLFQYDEQREELFTRVATELEIEEIRHSIHQGVTGHVVRHRTLANVPHPADDPRWDSSVDKVTGYHTQNLLAAPIISSHFGRLLGVLELINKREGAFDPFDEELVQAFTRHAAVALERAHLVEETQQRRIVHLSLHVVRAIHRGFMPHVLPQPPGYELACWWFPNEAVGGDYCDVVPLQNGCLALVIADVSGHGLGPSLIMASVRAALRALMLEQSTPDVLITHLARALADDLFDGRFISLALAALHTTEHYLDYANAGHSPALHYSQQNAAFHDLSATGLPLGVLDSPTYHLGARRRMELGDLIVFCTDGIVEAMNEELEQFGKHRLQQIISQAASSSAQEIAFAIRDQVVAYYIGETPPDDLTVLVAKRIA